MKRFIVRMLTAAAAAVVFSGVFFAVQYYGPAMMGVMHNGAPQEILGGAQDAAHGAYEGAAEVIGGVGDSIGIPSGGPSGTPPEVPTAGTPVPPPVPGAPVPSTPAPTEPPAHTGHPAGTVTRIVDGDTIDVDGNLRIRLALVNTPERGEPGYAEATAFTGRVCPVGATAAYDTDDGQRGGSYGRVIAKVWCAGAPDVSLNELLVMNGLAEIDSRFCLNSEFGSEQWAKQYGC